MAQEARIDVKTLFEKSTVDPSSPEMYELARVADSGPWFGMSLTAATDTARKADRVFPVVSERAYLGRHGTGTMAVHLANGHDQLVRPLIFADGFNYGKSNLDDLWAHFNTPYSPNGVGLFDQLLMAGVDIVLLGFDKRHDYIQVNAGVAEECIRRVIAKREGNIPLTVGGVSMGGVITRFALAMMERDGIDHETGTYLSYDSPHNGAWIPLILQQMAYFFESLTPSTPEKPSQAELIRSPAAQQLLWAWVEDSKYSGPVATCSPLRTQFVNELRELGWFPARPIKLGVANGRLDGVGRDLTPGEVIFDRRFGAPALPVASATARFQPSYGERQPVGGMHILSAVRRSETTEVPPFDGAPGGTLDSFGRVAAGLGVELDEYKRSGCFVPSVSSLALNYDPIRWDVQLDKDLRRIGAEESALDEYHGDDDNSAHSAVRAGLADWILARIAK